MPPPAGRIDCDLEALRAEVPAQDHRDQVADRQVPLGSELIRAYAFSIPEDPTMNEL